MFTFKIFHSESSLEKEFRSAAVKNLAFPKRYLAIVLGFLKIIYVIRDRIIFKSGDGHIRY